MLQAKLISKSNSSVSYSAVINDLLKKHLKWVKTFQSIFEKNQNSVWNDWVCIFLQNYFIVNWHPAVLSQTSNRLIIWNKTLGIQFIS
jgi:hypothetical protein